MDNQRRPTEEWAWEGNIQALLTRYFVQNGWVIEKTADTISGEHGPDIVMCKGERVTWVEVKGYPSRYYVRGELAGKEKRTRPENQAAHWFCQAIGKSLVRRGQTEDVDLALAFPDCRVYRDFSERAAWAFRKLDIVVYFVAQDGTVQML